MSAFEAIVLGLVQGLTEFLPISSSGHLGIGPAFFGWDAPGAVFTAVIPLGTMAAVLLYFRADLWRIASAWLRSVRARERHPREQDARLGWYIILGTIPIAVLGLAFKDTIENEFRNLELIGSALILFSLVMLRAEARSKRNRTLAELGRPAARLRSHGRRALLVPAVGARRRPQRAVRASPHRRGRRRAGGRDGDRHRARLRLGLRVDRLPAALSRRPLAEGLRGLPRRARRDRHRAGRRERDLLTG